MKFLIDRCAGRRLADWLRQEGFDVAEATQWNPDPGDRFLLARAAEEERILVTMDKDFGRYLFTEGASNHGLVRLPDVPAKERISIFQQLLSRHASELQAGFVITVRGGRVRFSDPVK